MPFHRKEFHKEENCLNCDLPLIGKYCANCGQKAFLHKERFWHMAMHFTGDYFHYDSKFWTTLKTLFTKPGLVTLEFINGKRAKYLNPVQLYIFVTTIFFLFFFSLSGGNEKTVKKEPLRESESVLNDSIALPRNATFEIVDGKIVASEGFSFKHILPEEKNITTYDSVQVTLPDSLKDDFFTKYVYHRLYYLSDKYGTEENFGTIFKERFLHNIPKIFFLLLPFFALLLKVFFRRKSFYYVDHIIFALHFHAMLFMIVGINYLLSMLIDDENIEGYLNLATLLGLGIYLFLSLRKVFEETRLKIWFKQLFMFLAYLLGFLVTALLVLAITFHTL